MKEEKKEQKVVPNPVTETEISDEELDKVNGGALQNRFESSFKSF